MCPAILHSKLTKKQATIAAEVYYHVKSINDDFKALLQSTHTEQEHV